MKVKLILDTRHMNKSGEYPVKISISQRGATALISLGIAVTVDQWDARASRIVRNPYCSQLNTFLTRTLLDVEMFLLNAETHGMSAQQLKILVNEYLHPTPQVPQTHSLLDVYRQFIETRTVVGQKHHQATLNRLIDMGIDGMTTEEITKEWLTEFDKYLSADGLKVNTRTHHLSNLRAMCNYAIAENLMTSYPFRGVKLPRQATKKRALSAEQLREIFNAQVSPKTQEAIDIFKLIFLLVGINIVDLCHLTEIVDGRIEYDRHKTNKHYSIKVEEEAMEIINKYRGKSHLIYAIERYSDYRYFTWRTNLRLQRIGDMVVAGEGHRRHKVYTPKFPGITTYWARHSWASIAVNDLDAPFDIVSKALGHSATSGAAVTSVYVNFDQRKVDKLNRAVIDWVLYGKK